ncbi:arylsulfatase [Sandaracinobacteroides hominis]|uniref:arylsulfatase n=1 Tax=Sandaracinobacteroides hominis TaxID=2780086 RepID=UPI0018F38FC4|nr:sulfatase-like hydrolase/transferase [Sandaracinobacteroides hominis]
MSELLPAATPAPELKTDGMDRRGFCASAGFAAAIATLSGTAALARGKAPRPNIVYILADDLGWADLGHRGSDIRTPNIDKLAREGAQLEDFYVQPMCTPTRAALMTGRYPLRYGLQTAVIPAGGTYGLATDEYLLPQALSDVGYKTALVGKWHLGHYDTDFWPRQRGFQHFYGALIGEIDHFKHSSLGVVDWYRDNERLIEEGYDTELFGNEAVKLIGAHDKAVPLFLYLAFTAPHTPYQAPEAELAKYAHIQDPQRRAFAAMITAMDTQIGRVVAELEKRGMRDNTLIVFHSDNGGTRSKMFVGQEAVEGELPADNGPYREGKGTLFEGGVRVGAIANWKGRIKPAKLGGISHITDMLPTLAGLAGASLKNSKPLDGKDIWPLIAGGASPRTDVVLNVEPTQGSIREGKWKLVWLAPLPSSVMLFDLEADPSEKTDVSQQNPRIFADLQKRVIALATEMKPPLFMETAVSAVLALPPNMPAGLGEARPAARH